MKVRLLGDMSGTRDGQQWPARGSTVDLPDDEAAQLCRQGMAIPVVDNHVEAAVVDDTTVEQRAITTDMAPAVSRRSRKQGV